MTDMNHDSARRLLARIALYAAASLVALGGVLFAVFWLPFRQTDDALPRSVEMLPLERRVAAEIVSEIDEPAYSWVDRDAGIVRVPIEQAMRVASKTLPVSDDAVAAAEQRQRTVVPTDAGSGRFVEMADNDSTPADE